MDYKYKLLTNVPNTKKSEVNIKNRFGKLTLTTKRQEREMTTGATPKQHAIKRELFKDYSFDNSDLLTDDESDDEKKVINQILITPSTANGPTITSNKYTETLPPLHLSDSDETNCSDIPPTGNENIRKDKETEIIETKISEMRLSDPISIARSESIFPTDSDEKHLLQLGQNNFISQPQDNSQTDHDTVSMNSFEKLNGVILTGDTLASKQENSIDKTIKSIKFELSKSIVSISSDCDEDENQFNTTDENPKSNEDIIILSDSDCDDEPPKKGTEASPICSSVNQTNSDKSISNTLMEKLNHFFDKIPSLPDGNEIEKLFFNENTVLAEKSLTHASDEELNKKTVNESLPEEIPDGNIHLSESEDEKEEAGKPNVQQKSSSQASEVIHTSERSKNSKHETPKTRVEQINISAVIKINIQISELESSTSSSTSATSPSSTNSSLNANKIVRKEKLATPEQNEPLPLSDSSAEINERVEREKIEPEPEPESEIVIDEDMEAMLNQIYGKSWQTPELKKQLSYKSASTNVSEILDGNQTGFNSFHKNVRLDLESTRLSQQVLTNNIDKKPEPKSTVKGNKVVTSPHFHILKKSKENVTPIKRKCNRKPAPITSKYMNILKVVDPDTSTDEEEDSILSNKSWENEQNSSSSSSSRDSDIKSTKKHPPRKKLTNKKTKKFNKKDFDFTQNASSDSENNDSIFVDRISPRSPDGTISAKARKFLNDCEFPKKPALPPTPINENKDYKNPPPSTKRKLFTKRYEEIHYQEDKLIEESKERFNEKEEEPIVKLNIPLPTWLAPPINKRLETLKATNLTPNKTPKNIERSKNERENDSGISVKTKTPKSNVKVVKETATLTIKKNEYEEHNRSFGFLMSLDCKVSKNWAHPVALYFRDNYKTTKIELTDKLYKMYNEKIFNNKFDVPITWNKKLLTTAGRCTNLSKSGIRSARIELSEKVLTSADRLRCTLIHEMCHAAAWIINGEKKGHAVHWKLWATKANTAFQELPKISVCHQYNIEYKYTYQCVNCNAKSQMHSKAKKVENIQCKYCKGAIQIFLNKKNKEGQIIQTPVREANGFAKFVKEKYKNFKQPHLTHAETMKLLSAEFSSMNVDKK